MAKALSGVEMRRAILTRKRGVDHETGNIDADQEG
jgi:hypothetical protein